MPPPDEAPPLPASVQLLIVRGLELRMPPPADPAALPWAIVRAERVTADAEKMLNMRLALFPLTVKFAAPGPLMLTLLLIANSPLVSVIVPVTPVCRLRRKAGNRRGPAFP